MKRGIIHIEGKQFEATLWMDEKSPHRLSVDVSTQFDDITKLSELKRLKQFVDVAIAEWKRPPVGRGTP